MTKHNRFTVRDGKLLEITAVDPERTREVVIPDERADLIRRMAAELNYSHAMGFELFRTKLRRMIGL